MKQTTLIFVLILILAIFLRLNLILPGNIILGFDQYRDLFQAKDILVNGDIKIIGPTAGNNAGLHHGVGFWYLLSFLMFFSKNPISISALLSLFNILALAAVYFLSKKLFNDNKKSLTVALLSAVSIGWIQYSGWISNPVITFLTVPLFFLFLFEYRNGRPKNLVLAAFFLGLSIQFELFMLYLIPVAGILFLALRMKFPNFKTIIFSILSFCFAISSLILTEIKFKGAGVLSLFSAGSKVGGQGSENRLLNTFDRLADIFTQNLIPQNMNLSKIIAVIIIFILFVSLFRNFKSKENRDKYLFLIIYLFSPFTMLVLGYHSAPWFLIGSFGAVVLSITEVLSLLKPRWLSIFAVIVIVVNLINFNLQNNSAYLLEPDRSSILKTQLSVAKYTFTSSNNNSFTINSLTNPLYINYSWSYLYPLFSNKKMPTFSGGDQLEPFSTLEKQTGNEKYLYLLIDKTNRIPSRYMNELINWSDKKSILVETVDFDGILVQKRLLWN